MIVCPVNWYQAPSSLKLMIDRLVCADGGNPDFTSTGGKDPEKAKKLELAGWPYPRHLEGRVFSVVVHGDAAGTENLRRILSDWLQDIGLNPWAKVSGPDRPLYRVSDVRNAAHALVQAVKDRRSGKFQPPDRGSRSAPEVTDAHARNGVQRQIENQGRFSERRRPHSPARSYECNCVRRCRARQRGRK